MKTRFALMFASHVLLVATVFAQVERTITKTFPLDNDGRVSIDTYKGSVDVQVWDKEEVFMEARIELEDEHSDDAQEAVDLVDIEIEERQGAFRVETSYDRLNKRRKSWKFWDNWGMELPSVHYTLRIPGGASLRLDDYKSSTRISGLSSILSLVTYKGDAVVEDHRGKVRLDTYKGEIVIEFSDTAYESSFETYKGDITVSLPQEAGFDVRLDLGRRADLRSDFDIRANRRRQDDVRGRDVINGGGPTLRFESTKGTIRLDSR